MDTLGPSCESVRQEAQIRANEQGKTYYLRVYARTDKHCAYHATTSNYPEYLEAIHPQQETSK